MKVKCFLSCLQAPLGPIGKKPALAPLKKLAPLGAIDKSPLAPLGSLRSDSFEKPKLTDIGRQTSTSTFTAKDSETSNKQAEARSPPRNVSGKLALGGLGRSFLKTESEESVERRDDSEQNSVRSGSSQRGILKSQTQQHDVLLRQAMIQREEKRIMFDLGSNIEFASEVNTLTLTSNQSNNLTFPV